MFGCLALAATGCKRSGEKSPYAQLPKDTMPITGTPMQLNTSKSLWGHKDQPPVSVPVEVTPEISNKPPSAETLVAIADTQLEAAFEERTAPGSREQLLDRARQGYQKALKQEPKSKAALLGVARYYAKLGEREKALDAYKKYLHQFPKDADTAHEIAIAHARWKDFPGAVAWCEHALKIDPENRSVKKTLGFCLARAGKWEAAFEMLCQIMPEAQARHNLAGMLDHMGYSDASKIQLQLATQVDPSFAPARDFLTELTQPVSEMPDIQTAGGMQPDQ